MVSAGGEVRESLEAGQGRVGRRTAEGVGRMLGH